MIYDIHDDNEFTWILNYKL